MANREKRAVEDFKSKVDLKKWSEKPVFASSQPTGSIWLGEEESKENDSELAMEGSDLGTPDEWNRPPSVYVPDGSDDEMAAELDGEEVSSVEVICFVNVLVLSEHTYMERFMLYVSICTNVPTHAVSEFRGFVVYFFKFCSWK